MTVHEGDNRASLTNLRGIADRCHLGLLLSSELAWEPCLLALKSSGGVLHVHMSVEEENIDAWTTATVNTFETLVAQHGLNFNVRADHLERLEMVRSKGTARGARSQLSSVMSSDSTSSATMTASASRTSDAPS